ncbi:hypothetical protein ACFY5H_17940 [Streptomyces sp. NPDC013012]|uniref:hypothetical protein n=1 Tax=Streptomyces sp. NPDC013012 TaxID=3364860 RepID=UPI00367D065B
MLTYAEIMTTDFAALTTAAEKWESMAGEIKKVENRYKDTVQKVTMGPNWLGLSAGVAQTNFAGTRYEYAAAQTQAKAVGSLLRDAHTQFVDLKKKLDSARTDAIDAGMTVSEEGRVSFDHSKLTDSERRAYRNDPDGQRAIGEAVTKWQKHIDDRVKAVSDADDGVKIALEAVVVDSNKDIGGKGDDQLNGFNAGAKGDVELYEAENAKDIATRINSGEKVSAADYAELNRSFRDNSDNKAFSQTFVGGMGADGTIKLANALNDRAHGGDQSQRGLYRDVNKGLADTLAGATAAPAFKDPDGKKLAYGTKAYQDAFAEWSKTSDAKFYNDFMGDLKKAGVEKYGLDVAGDKISVGTGHGQEVRGYQALATLMQQGSGYSPQFLGDLTDDMIAAEKKDKNIWDLHGSFDDKKDGWFKNDPVDGVLNVMSRDPEAATGYLDPKADGDTNDRLKYLLKDRDWDFVNTTDWRGNIETTGKDASDGDVRTGLGLALEAATTGHTPLKPGQDPWPETPHTEAQARIMHDTIGTLGPDQKVHENLREPLARSLASYTADTHEILAGLDGDYIRASGSGFFTEGGTTHMSASQADLVQFIRGLSDDPEAYGTLYKAESRYSSLVMEGIPQGATGDNLRNPLDKSGTVLGVYSSVMEDVVNDDRMGKYSEADWKAKVAYHVIGGAVTPLYFTTAGGVSIAFGDSIQRGVDTWAWQWGNEMKAAADTEANAKIADKYLTVNNQVPIMVEDWAKDRPDLSGQTVQSLSSLILNGHDRGANTAQKYLTDTTN